MQFWPRVRASRQYAQVRSYPQSNEAKPLAFAGYKAGMTHVMAIDTNKNSPTKGEQISVPATVIECPPLKIYSVRFYTPKGYGTAVSTELFFKAEKELSKKTPLAKKVSAAEDLDKVDLTEVKDITLQVYTQPKLAGFGQKKPEVFEIGLGGSVQDKLAYVKEQIGKDIAVSDVISQGANIDLRAVTKGKGYQGPVKRFGVAIRARKSEKTKRGPGSLGAWIAQGHTMYRIAFAGQMGYHNRTQYNNLVLDIVDDASAVNPKGGFINYGEAKNTCVLIKGSVPGPKKRLVTMTAP
ncbi:MAG: 50S ribosomal protein L3, partial [Simkania sp.]|nr:50S ribosomal protein L3 [Simkania sp.]